MDICSAEEPFLRLMLDGTVISTRLIGAYNAANVLAAIAVGDYFGIPREESIAAVESFVPDNERSEMRRTQKNALIVDAYNANPTSMAAALDNFERMLGGGRGGRDSRISPRSASSGRTPFGSTPACCAGSSPPGTFPASCLSDKSSLKPLMSADSNTWSCMKKGKSRLRTRAPGKGTVLSFGLRLRRPF